MLKRFSHKFGRNMVIIYPWEFHVGSGEIIATVLGSCISVCIRDTKTGIAGMNHFMLPGDVRSEEMFFSASTKYGMFAMEQLINEMLKKNGSKKDFEAKVFGGGHVLNFRKTDGNVPESNIMFVRAFLRMEQIPVAGEDVGGLRKEDPLFPDSGQGAAETAQPTVDSISSRPASYKAKFSAKRSGCRTGRRPDPF